MTDDIELLNTMSTFGHEQVNSVPSIFFQGQVGVEPLAAVGIIEEALIEVQHNLADFAASTTFETDMLTVFGESADVDLGKTIIEALANGENLPQINVVSAEQMNSAAGGFDSLTGEIYLADDIIGEYPNLVDVLTEEIAHSIDSAINEFDTPGDEGEYFRALADGYTLNDAEIERLLSEDDRVEILDGAVVVEANSELTFETKTFPTGDQPEDIAAADFDKDGKQDIVVTNNGNGANSVSVFFGDGKGGATTALLFSVEARPARLTVGDLDKDGNQDIVTGSFTDGTVTALFGNGKGQFSPPSKLSVSDSTLEPLIADVNRDGKPDIVIPNYYDNSISVLLGNGNRTFTSAMNFTTGGTNPEDIVIKDINGDRKLDILVINHSTGSLSMLPGNGDGTFGLPSSFAVGGKADAVAEKDLNRDGKADLAIATIEPDGVSVMLGLGKGSFGFPTNYPTGSLPKDVAIGDLNNDGKFDLIVTNRESDNISVLMGKAKGLFDPAINFPVGEYPWGLVVDDFNNDGKLDIAVVNRFADTISILTNTSQIATIDPKITISDTTITEGNQGKKNAKFTVNLDNASSETVKVNYTTANGTAKAGKDYQKTNGILTFKPGQTQKTINVPILGDTLDENNERFNLNLSKPRNAKLKDKRGIATIRDNDETQPELSISDAQITENNQGKKQLKFDVTLNTKVNKRVEVNYATVEGTAEEGTDYQKTQGKLTFKPNQKKKTITVPIKGDTLNEDDEKFSVTLSKPKNAKLGDKRGVGTIKDNDDGGSLPGSSFETAVNLGKLTGEVVRVDEIGFTEGTSRNTNDFYSFRTEKEGTLVLVLDDLLKNANLDLYGSGGELINQSKNDGITRESIITTLDPGTYFVRVYPQGSSRTPYRLSVDLL